MAQRSAQVWITLRAIYENCSIGVEWQEIIDFVQSAYPDEKMPSISRVRHRCNEEQWKKKDDLFQLSNNRLRAILYKHHSSKKLPKTTSQIEQYAVLSMNYLAKKEKLFSEHDFRQRKMANVILEHRRMNYKSLLVLDRKLGQLIEAEEKLLNFTEYFQNNPDEFEGIEFETAYTMQVKNVKLIMEGLLAVESLTRSVNNLIKNDVGLYGILPEDTREPDTDKRLTSLQDDETYFQEQQRLAIERRKEVAKRMEMLQNGQYEEQVKQQQMETARENEAIDIDDAEFTEIL